MPRSKHKQPDSDPRPSAKAWSWGAFAIATLAVVLFSSYARLGQLEAWKEEPESHFVAQRPLMTSTDAYYWLRLAEEHRSGVYARSDRDPLQAFPDGGPRLRPVPLISVFLAFLARFCGGDVFRAGVYLAPLLAGLFVVPLGLYFRRLGLPAAGLLGGLIGSFGFEYYTRTSIGGVDTDALNLFFPFAASLCVLCAGEADSDRRTIAFSALAGLTVLVFHWWYYHPGFNVVYLVLLVLYLALARKPARTLAISTAVFAVVSNPLYLWRGMSGLAKFAAAALAPSASTTLARSLPLPDLLSTVAESQRVAVADALRLVLDSSPLTAVGLVLFAILALREWRRLLPLAPVLLLGLVTFSGGKRYAIFLGPFVGVGYGYLIGALVSRAFRTWKRGRPYRPVAGYAAAGLFFVAIAGTTAARFVPAPSLSSRTISSIAEAGERLGAATPVLGWWDYGYALAGVGGLATFQDGSYHGVETYLIARALSATSDRELHATAAYLTNEGPAALGEALDQAASPRSVLTDVGRYSVPLRRDDVHLILLEAMISKYAAIHYLGTWDLDHDRGAPDGYERIRCSRWQDQQLQCAGMVIDTRTGEARADLSLERLVIIRDGHVVSEKPYPRDTDVVLQVLTDSRGAFDFYLLTQRVYESNFNQMYFLGRFDSTRFELVYSDFPAMRLYRVR
jgi:dolichyl-diphosphooligosaccharide--protein glycosyltransferase